VIKKLAIGVAIVVPVWIFSIGWQVGAAELGNIELQDDMKDMASQLGARIGFSAAKSDDDFRKAVIQKAQKYGIELEPEQVTVERTTSGDKTAIYLSADYRVHIHVVGFSHELHFQPHSDRVFYQTTLPTS
jgi:hypothetical protein